VSSLHELHAHFIVSFGSSLRLELHKHNAIAETLDSLARLGRYAAFRLGLIDGLGCTGFVVISGFRLIMGNG
jgi:hypothetical protein